MKRVAKFLLLTFLLLMVVVIYPVLAVTYNEFVSNYPVEDIYEVSVPFSTHSSVAVGYVDVYRVYLNQGQSVTVSVAPLTSYGSGSDPDIYVFRSSDGQLVTESVGVGADTVGFTVTQSGYYLICVHGFDGPNGRCYYSISIQSSGSQLSPSQPVGPAPQPAPQLPFNIGQITQIFNAIVNNFVGLINVIFSGIHQYIITPIFQVFQAIINGVRTAIQTIAQGVENVLRAVFGGGS